MKVARAFDVFRKLGMRHMCVVDYEGMLVGFIKRKDLMTFRLSDNIRLHKAEALLRGWADRWRAKKALERAGLGPAPAAPKPTTTPVPDQADSVGALLPGAAP